MLSKERVEELLFQYKKYNTKLAKSKHHSEFLQECRHKRQIPRGLQLRLTINVVEEDKGLEGQIKGILMQTELEILDEIITCYGELNEKLTDRVDKLKTTLSDLEEDHAVVKETFEDSRKQTNILRDKLKHKRREDK